MLLSGCSGTQSALDPAGEEADAVYTLFLVMAVGGTLIWLGVVGLLVHATRRRAVAWPDTAAARLIVWGGVALPATALFALLTYAVWLMPAIRPWLERETLARETIEVVGEQFWWRIRYPAADGLPAFETANELRLPVGYRVAFALTAADVIHSFWVPALGGKMDMIPGRTNRLSLRATREGIFRAPCAEFCGTSHTFMAFSVVVMEPDAYLNWRRSQTAGSDLGASEGARLFVKHGCAGCHGIRGVTSATTLGPDLTLFGQRQTVGAGALINATDNVARFIRAPEAVKPGARMPGFDMLPDDDVRAIAHFLSGLK